MKAVPLAWRENRLCPDTSPCRTGRREDDAGNRRRKAAVRQPAGPEATEHAWREGWSTWRGIERATAVTWVVALVRQIGG